MYGFGWVLLLFEGHLCLRDELTDWVLSFRLPEGDLLTQVVGLFIHFFGVKCHFRQGLVLTSNSLVDLVFKCRLLPLDVIRVPAHFYRTVLAEVRLQEPLHPVGVSFVRWSHYITDTHGAFVPETTLEGFILVKSVLQLYRLFVYVFHLILSLNALRDNLGVRQSKDLFING